MVLLKRDKGNGYDYTKWAKDRVVNNSNKLRSFIIVYIAIYILNIFIKQKSKTTQLYLINEALISQIIKDMIKYF